MTFTRDDLKQAVEAGHFKCEDQYEDDPESLHFLAFLLWNGNEVTVNGHEVEVLESSDLGGMDNDHGRPVKVVFKVYDTVFIAEDEYDSWGGSTFSDDDCVSEAELVNVPTWVAKGSLV